MSRVSLLPVANVDESAVQKVPGPVSVQLGFTRKSRVNDDALNPPVNVPAIAAPLESKKLDQSSAWTCGGLPTFVVVLATTSPSSWNFRSCVACAPPARKSPSAMTRMTGNGRKRKRLLRLLPSGPKTRCVIRNVLLNVCLHEHVPYETAVRRAPLGARGV